MQSLLDRHWHHLPREEVLDLLDSSAERGLDRFEVDLRQQTFGPNSLTPKRGHGPLVRFLFQFHQPLVYILLLAAVITALLGEWVDASVIFGVVLVNAIIGFIQEAKALTAIDALSRVMTSEATVLRAGEKMRISALVLVPGDIVFLQSGDKVPADLRLLRSRELQIDESALTGESVPVEKASEILPHDTILADRKNIACSGTLVTYGTGWGVVTAIGDATEIGRISSLISSAEVLATPLTRKIAQFSSLLLYMILGMAVLTFLVGAFRGESWFDMFMASVALAVGAIPEGLPAAVTITLAIGMARMARRNTVIRKLPAVETLGSTTVICSDKTGTLTQNQMTVQQVYAGGVLYDVSGVGYEPDGVFSTAGKEIDPDVNQALLETFKAGLLCNDSRLRRQEARWRVEGDPTEGALIAVAMKAGLRQPPEGEALPSIDTIPFESQHQYMATLHDQGCDKPRIVYLKGSVESLLQRCTAVLDAAGNSINLDADGLLSRVAEMASQGLRVLAFARADLPVATTAIDHGDVASCLTLLGLQGMIDPPRPEAVQAVRDCREAGIQVKMITGDHGGTAAAVAGQIGLDGLYAADPGATVITGKQLAEMPDSDLISTASETTVFARVSPEQKLRLVEALQARDHVVAMTGDGVNDAPALRRANIGVAMGLAGTEVAREAAEMVLTDDNFSSIVAAVEEGRGVFDNLVKFITWTLPTNLGEGLVIMAAVLAGIALPILPVQILWINMSTAVLLGMMLAFESKEEGIMQRQPRNPRAPILNGVLLFRVGLVGVLLLIGTFGLFEWALREGADAARARTIAVNMLVTGELFYLFNCRSLTRSMFEIGVFSNRWLLSGVAGMILLQLMFT
ncbi:MAG: cation-transporting P-type ATPase, partial [Pseudomonadota bacterium]|nr:cation-transporting P-type ATPase [Pseudomonadota bacterium]